MDRAYGATIGLALAAALIALAFVRLRLPRVDRRRLLVRLAPIAACTCYLVIVVLPWWDVLPDFSQWRLYPPLSFLTISGMLVGIHLLGLWVRQVAGPSATAELVLAPLALLALTAVDLIARHEWSVTWNGGAVVGLALLLAVLGHMERRGLENVRVPEILRVDRL